MNMWFEYQRERFKDFMVLEKDYGFATYSYLELESTNGVYIEDIYIVPDERKNNRASELSNEIQDIAKKQGMTHLFGSVATDAEGADTSIKVLQAHGMKFLSSTNEIIWFIKEI